MSKPVEKIVFTCIGGHRFTEFEMEMGMTQTTMDYLMARDELAHNTAADLAREAELAREHALGHLDCPWPWYADEPVEEVAPDTLPYEVGLWCA